MIEMRRQGESWAPEPRRPGLRALVILGTVVAIALFAISMRPSISNGAVLRVALDRVPVERAVSFAHAGPSEPVAAEKTQRSELQSAQPELRQAALPGGSFQQTVPQLTRASAAIPPPAEPDASGVLPIGFSLTQGVSSEKGGVGVAKTLAAESGQATGLTIFLIGGSVIEVDRNELVAALAQLGAGEKAASLPDAGDTGRLSLDRVRTAGLDLRYDAVQDRLVLRP